MATIVRFPNLNTRNYGYAAMDTSGALAATTYYNTSDPTYKDKILNGARSLLSRRATKVLYPSTGNPFFIGTWVVSDTDPTSDLVFPVKEKVKTINYDFEKRCANGEIIMSPYYVCSGLLRANKIRPVGPPAYRHGNWSYGRALTDSASNTERDQRFEHADMIKELSGMDYDEYQEYWYKQIGFKTNNPKTQIIVSYAGTQVDCLEQVLPNAYPWSDSFFSKSELAEISQMCQQFMNDQDIKNDLIQDCLAKANQGTLDLLTSLAELPETFTSILDGFRTLFRITREAKAGQFRLFQQRGTLADQKIRRAYSAYTSRYMQRISYANWARGKTGSNLPARYQRWRAQQMANLQSFDRYSATKGRRYRAEAAREVADSLAQLELNYRYNISTTIYMLEDIGETYLAMRDNILYECWRVRETDVSSPTEINGYRFEGTHETQHRVLIKRAFEIVPKLDQLGRLLMKDILVTGYEMVRIWSIVADWFVTIGPMLRAFRWSEPEKQQVSSYSWRNSLKGTLYYPSPHGEVSVAVELESYRRIIIGPEGFYGIYWKPDVSFWRRLDALSFLWGTISPSVRLRNHSLR